MNTSIYKVISLSDVVGLATQRGTEPLKKRTLVLEDLNGDSFVAAAFGENAELTLAVGDTVAATLWAKTREYNGNVYQDVTVRNIVALERKLKF